MGDTKARTFLALAIAPQMRIPVVRIPAPGYVIKGRQAFNADTAQPCDIRRHPRRDNLEAIGIAVGGYNSHPVLVLAWFFGPVLIPCGLADLCFVAAGQVHPVNEADNRIAGEGMALKPQGLRDHARAVR